MSKKNYRFFAVSALAVLFACVAVLLSLSPVRRADAATVTATTFTDDFSREDLSDKWLRNDFAFAQSTHYAMRFDNHGSYGAAVFYKGYTVHGDCTIRFDFRQTDIRANATTGQWFAFLFGGNDASAHFRGCNAALLCDRRPYTQLMDDTDGTTEGLGNTTYDDHAKYRQSITAAAMDEAVYTVEITLTRMNKVREADGENLYALSMAYYKKGSAPVSPQILYDDVAADGYFGFSVMANATYDISDFKIYEEDTVVVSEDFADKAGGKGATIVTSKENAVWKTCNFSASRLFTYYDARIDLHAAQNGLMLGDYRIKIDKKSEISYTLSYAAEIESLPENAAFGLALGLARSATSGVQNEFIGIEGCAENAFRFVHIKNGALTEASGAFSSSSLIQADAVPVTLTAYYDGRVTLRVGSYAASFTGVTTGGYFGLATRGEKAGVCIRSLKLLENTYTVSSAENRGIDFKGVKETVEEDFTYRQRFVDESKWFLGQNVSLPRFFSDTNDYVSFNDSNEASFFGAKQIYTEFIARFTVTIAQNAADSVGAYLGLSFGKTTRADAAADCASVMFGKTSSGMVLQALGCSIVGTTAKTVRQPDGLDFWSSDDWSANPVSYRVMVVVRGGKAYVYYAPSDAAETEMETPRAVLYGMETTRGYVTVSAYGGATFYLNEYSVTNIAHAASAASTEDPESDRLDFFSGAQYTGTGKGTTRGGVLSLGPASSITTKSKFTSLLAFLELCGAAGDGVTIRLGESYIRLNGDGGVYSNMTKIKGGDAMPFSKLSSGGTMMLEAVGETVALSVIAADTPPSLLEEPLVVFKTARRTAAVPLSIETGNSAVLSLSEVRLYTRKSRIEIKAENWTHDLEWPQKNAPTAIGSEAKTGCGAAVATSALIPAALLIAAGVASLRMGKKKGGKTHA